jgi:hypothetical protein
MRKITKNELRASLFVDYNLVVKNNQITLTKTSINNVMIVEGIGGYGFFRYGLDNNGILRIYPNKMHEVNLNV